MSSKFRPKLLIAALLSLNLAVAGRAAADPVELTDWVTSGSAAVQGGEMVLTQDIANQSGAVALGHQICAGKFRMSFEVNLGVNTSTKGGLGIGIFARNASGQMAFRAHADSSFQSSEDQRYELNDNHVSIDTMWAPTDALGNSPTSGNVVFGPVAAARMPFLMKAAGWFHGELYRDGQNIQITFSDGTSGLILNAPIYPASGESFTLGFSADTSVAAHNLQRVRGVTLDLIDRSECSDYVAPYSRDAAHAEVVNRCGDVNACPARETYLTCVQNALADMMQNNQVVATDSDFLLLEAQYGLTFCDGYKQCQTEIDPTAVRADGYSAGFAAGVASIDQNAIRAAGYSSGFAAGQADGDAAGYSRGYSAGDAAGYARGYDRGKTDGSKSGYDKGYSDGMAAGSTSGYQTGYSEGSADGYNKGLAAANGQCTLDKAMDSFKSRILAACPCSDKKNKNGDYVSCTRNLLNSMRKGGEIDSLLETYMFETVRTNQCRGELRFKFPWGN